MKTRVLFLLSDEDTAATTAAQLRAIEIPDADIHAIAKSEKYPLKADLSDSEVVESSNLINSVKRGAALGGTTGLFAGLAASVIAPLGIVATGGLAGIAGLTVAGAAVGSWASSLIGISVPNTDLEAYQAEIEQGKILMLIDVEPSQLDETLAKIHQLHPQADIKQGEAPLV